MEIEIIGIGQTKFGELWKKDLQDLAYESMNKALVDAGISIGEIDAIVVANMLGGGQIRQSNLGAFCASLFNFTKPAWRVEAAEASGGVAIYQAMQGIKAGEYKKVLVCGLEKMTDDRTREALQFLSEGVLQQQAGAIGASIKSLYALLAQRYIHVFNASPSDFSQVAVKNHFYGQFNPYAQYRREISLESVLNSQIISTPISLLDCASLADGAAAVVLSSSSKEKGVFLLDTEIAVDSLTVGKKIEKVSFPSVQRAWQRILQRNKWEKRDFNLLEVHDNFTVSEVIAMEDLGFCSKGEGINLFKNKGLHHNSEISVNLSGGLKAIGDAVAANGIRQIVDLTRQLRGEYPIASQKKDIKKALALNTGGMGSTAVVSALEKK